MALIRRADLGDIVRDAVVLDLDDLGRRGEELRAQALAEAARIVADARESRAKLLETAQAEGHAKGLEQGLAQGLDQGREQGRAEALAQSADEFERLTASWTGAIEQFESIRQSMLDEARSDVLALAVRFAQRVVKRKIELDPGVAAAQLAEILSLLARPTRLIVAVNPADRAVVAEALPALTEGLGEAQHIELIDDASLDPGSCVARTAGGGVFDASIATQLDRLINELLPEPGSAATGDAA